MGIDPVRDLAEKIATVADTVETIRHGHTLNHSAITVDGTTTTLDDAVRGIRSMEANLLKVIRDAAETRDLVDGQVVAYTADPRPTTAKEGDWHTSPATGHVSQWRDGAWHPVTSTAVVAAMRAAANAQSAADGKIVCFEGDDPPTAEGVGDLWIRTPDNRKHRWSGTAWVELKDSAIATAQETADSKSATFRQAAAPTAGMKTNDTWYRTTDKRTHCWDGTAWVAIVDAAIVLARNEAKDADEKATEAALAAALAKQTADRKIDSFRGTTPPATADDGDFFTHTGTGEISTWRAGAWHPVTSSKVVEAINAAAAVDQKVEGKTSTYSGLTGPTAKVVGDLWIRDSDKRMHRWDGSAWAPVVDAAIVLARKEAKDADDKATDADTKAVGAQSTADQAKADAATADGKAVEAQSTADSAKTIAEQAHADHDDAMSDGTNPLFRDYPAGAAAPTDWLPWVNGPTRTIVDGHPVPRFTTNATDNAGMSFSTTGVMKNISTRKQYLTIEVELTCHSGTFSGAGVRIDYGGMSGFRYALMPFKAFVDAPVAGQRYRLRSTIRFRPDATGTHTSWGGYLFSNYSSLSDYGPKSAKSFTLHRFAISTASAADIAALEARSLVDGKNAVRWETTTPIGNGATSGDVWYRKNASDDIVGIWRWDGTSWKPKTLANEVVSSLTADKLRTGTLTAGTVITAGPTSGVHTTIKPEGITTYGADGKTELVRLGSGTDDRLAIADNASRVVAAVNVDGSASFKTVSVDDVLLNTADWTGSGGSLLGLMDRRPRGVVAFGGRYVDSSPSTGETPIYEIAFTAQKNRLYRISTSSHRVDSGVADALMVIRVREEHSQWVAPGAPMFVAAAPSTSSTILTEAIQSTGPAKITALNVSKFHQFTTDPGVANGHYQAHVRLSVSLVAFGSNTAKLVANVQNGNASSPAEIVVEDIGPARGNYATIINQTNVPPTPPPQSRTLTRSASWVSTFRGSGSLRTDTDHAMQGQTPHYTPGGINRAFIGFADVTGEVAGSVIEKVEIYVYCNHSHYGAGGTAVVGTHGVATRPTTVPAGSTPDRLRRHFNRGQGQWIDITHLGKDDWKTGATRGITLGPSPDTNATYYMRFDGGSGSKPQLRITYKK